MHQAPLKEYGSLHTHACHSNALFAAPVHEAAERADPELCRPPNTGPKTKSELAQWLTDKHSQLRERINAWNKRADCFNSEHSTLHPKELWHKEQHWENLCQWFSKYDAEVKKCEAYKDKAKPRRFRYNDLPGGRNGIRIPGSERDPRFTGMRIHIKGKDGPCIAQRWTPVQENTELNLANIWRYVLDTWDTEDPFPDMEIAWELCWVGLSNRSNYDKEEVVCMPNYNGFWDNLTFAQKKENEKLTAFRINRLVRFEATDFCPAVPSMHLPRSVQTQQKNADGSVKPRATIDPGAGGRPGQKEDHDPDPSINAKVDLENKELFPSIKYFTVAALGEAAAILKTSGLKLHQSAYDAEFFYEQFPRVCDEIDAQFQKVSSGSSTVDTRAIFGMRAEPATLNRCGYLIRWCTAREMDKLQTNAERTNILSAEATKYIKMRRKQGHSGSLAATGIYFDDQGTVCIEEVKRLTLQAQQTIWQLFEVSMADGRTDPHRTVKDKRLEMGEGEGELVLLGLVLDLVKPGRRTLGTQKKRDYAATGRALLATASIGETWNPADLETWVGQMGWAATVNPALRLNLNILRSALGSEWNKHHVTPTAPARSVINQLIEELESSQGVALMPTLAPYDGSTGIPVFHIVTDAARDPNTKGFKGYGGFITEPGSTVIHWFKQEFSKYEMEQLHPSALELYGMTAGIFILAQWAQQWLPEPSTEGKGIIERRWLDVVNICDNQSASEHIANSNKAHKEAERQLIRERTTLLIKHRIRAASVHCIRETEAIQAADHLSNGDVTAAQEKLQHLFGQHKIKMIELPPPRSDQLSLEGALRAQKYPRLHNKRRKQ